MAVALDYLQKLSNSPQNNWLISAGENSGRSHSSDNFLSLAQNYYQELNPFIAQNLTPKILINDRNPVRFLAKFLATTAAELPVFLGNPQWGIQEEQQAEKLVQPNFIWTDKLLPTTNAILELQPSRIMIPTGGSFGVVKFAMHTWQTLSASVTGLQSYFQISVINSFCILPVYHVSGLMQFMRSLLTGGKLVITTSKYLESGINLAIDPQDFFISLVPTQLQKLLANPATSTWLSQFQAVFLGGAAPWQALLDQARKLQIPLALTYGMTETASQIATLKPQDFLAGNNTCGQVLPHAQIFIQVPLLKGDLGGSHLVDTDNTKATNTGAIAIQSSSLALGYYPNLWEKNPNFEIFETDDLGYLDTQGYLSIIGRRSLMIVTGGEKVFPPEVEAVILATKLVQDICVLGLPDLYWGEIVAAFYVPINSAMNSQVNLELNLELNLKSNLDVATELNSQVNLKLNLEEIEEAIAAHLTNHLAKYKHPKIWLCVEKLPRNSQGKINYQHLLSAFLPQNPPE